MPIACRLQRLGKRLPRDNHSKGNLSILRTCGCCSHAARPAHQKAVFRRGARVQGAPYRGKKLADGRAHVHTCRRGRRARGSKGAWKRCWWDRRGSVVVCGSGTMQTNILHKQAGLNRGDCAHAESARWQASQHACTNGGGWDGCACDHWEARWGVMGHCARKPGEARLARLVSKTAAARKGVVPTPAARRVALSSTDTVVAAHVGIRRKWLERGRPSGAHGRGVRGSGG